jgi:hypothetical protein
MDGKILWVEYGCNTTIHSSTKLSPFKALYNVHPPSLISYVLRISQVQAMDDLLRTGEVILHELR